MKILGSINIPQLFSAFRNILQHGVGQTYTLKSQYYCLECKAPFGTTWSYKGSLQGFGDSRAFCPQCGTLHDHRGVRLVTRTLEENESAPLNTILTLTEGKGFISLKLSASTIRFSELWNVIDAKVDEEFKFDTKRRKTTFRRKVNRRLTDEFEIGNPFDQRVFNVSLLYFLTADSAVTEYSKAISSMLRILRETVQSRLEVSCKHKVKSMHVSSGSEHGRLLLPIFNIAFRMVFIDAPNLPDVYRNRLVNTERFWNEYSISDDDMDAFNSLDYFRKKNNYIDTLIEMYHLPTVRSIRKILQKDFFAFRLLNLANSITDNIDHIVTLYPLMYQMSVLSNTDFDDMCYFSAEISKLYGVESAIQMMLKAKGDGKVYHQDYWYVIDTVRMYRKLSAENRKLLTDVKFSELHDWLSVKIAEQKSKGVNFEVPEHIKRRLMMQKKSIKFFLPQKSTELLAAGSELHNCVGTYDERMAANELQIVLVADDSGKLVACLEVKNNALVQAKIKNNQPVSRNAKINAEVTEWAKEAGVKIRTLDVREIYLPVAVAAV